MSMLNKHKTYTTDIPRDLIEAKRLQVQITRACKPPVTKELNKYELDLNNPSSYRTYCKACCTSDNRAKELERTAKNNA